MRHMKWLAYLMTAVMLLCLAPDTAALAASRDECLTPTGIYTTHQWSSWQTEKAATCKETGTRVRTCRNCGQTQRETIPKANHSYGPWKVTKAPTCSAAGEETRRCSVCGLVHTRAVPADPEAHVFGPWQTVREAAAGQSGLMRRICTLCGAAEEETVPPGGGEASAPPSPVPEGKKAKCAITLTGEDGPEGEDVISLKIENTGEEDLTNISLDVQLQAEDGSFHMARLIDDQANILAVGEVLPFDFHYDGQPESGFTFVAAAYGAYSGRLCTANLKYDLSAASKVRSMLLPTAVEVTKEVETAPPEGQAAFRVGDPVNYAITVRNNLDFKVTGTVYDIVNEQFTIVGSLDLESGAEYTFHFTYVIKEDDVKDGLVTDTGSFDGFIIDPAFTGGDAHVSGESGPVRIPVEEEMTILKEEISQSDDPKGYVLGETVKFRLTVHNGYKYPVTGVLWDNVSSLEDPVKIAEFTIDPGESLVFEYDYDVRQIDVENKVFSNNAYAEVLLFSMFGTQEYDTVWSNGLRIDVIDKGPTYPPRTPTPAPVSICRRVLTACGSEGGIYECTFCNTHLAVEQKVRGLGAAEARTVWTAAVNGLYADVAAKYPGAAQLAEKDRTLFYAQLDLYEKMLTDAFGAAVAGEMILDELRDRCIDLCYALHTAPQARRDSVRGTAPTLKTSGTMPAECVRTRRKNSAGFTLTETLCADHGYIGYIPDAASPGEEDFSWVRRLWEAALTTETAALRSSTPAKAKEAVSAFLDWTGARGELLKALYNDGTVVQEVLVFTVRGRTLDLERNKR
ncbi:MAG: hypothetical protein IKP22_02080 [Clostridia bacterium]|nr:hypothetical protein [Clostridia bacterium]